MVTLSEHIWSNSNTTFKYDFVYSCTSLQRCPIRTKYLLDAVFWLTIFFQLRNTSSFSTVLWSECLVLFTYFRVFLMSHNYISFLLYVSLFYVKLIGWNVIHLYFFLKRPLVFCIETKMIQYSCNLCIFIKHIWWAVITIQLMTLDEVNTTMYQPQRSDYHRGHPRW